VQVDLLGARHEQQISICGIGHSPQQWD